MASQLLGMIKSKIIQHVAGKVKTTSSEGLCYAAFLIGLPYPSPRDR